MSLPESIPSMIQRGASTVEIADAVQQNLAGYAQTVHVHDTSYTFFSGTKEAVAIVIEPSGTTIEKLRIYIQKLLWGLPAPESPFNGTRIYRYITQKQDDPTDKKEIESVFRDKRKIYVYISRDGVSFYVDLEVGQGLCSIS